MECKTVYNSAGEAHRGIKQEDASSCPWPYEPRRTPAEPTNVWIYTSDRWTKMPRTTWEQIGWDLSALYPEEKEDTMEFNAGDRVKRIITANGDGEGNVVNIGELGTVVGYQSSNSFGLIDVNWDNGVTFGNLPGYLQKVQNTKSLTEKVTDYLADPSRSAVVKYFVQLVDHGFFRTTNETEQEKILREVLEGACESGRRKALVALGLEKEPQWVRKQIKVADIKDDVLYATASKESYRYIEDDLQPLCYWGRQLKRVWLPDVVLDVFVKE